MDHIDLFISAGFFLRLYAFSALDRYWGRGKGSLPFVWAETDADISDIARFFDEIRFPGSELADAATEIDGITWYFRCLDPENPSRGHISYDLLAFTQDVFTKRFQDSLGVYPLLRNLRDARTAPSGIAEGSSKKAAPAEAVQEDWWETLNREADFFQAIFDGALVLARYEREDKARRSISSFVGAIDRIFPGQREALESRPGRIPSPETQRVYLISLLLSPHPALGFEALRASGALKILWPELEKLDSADHSKEFHPEGNAWRHTLETLRYRKTLDITLSLGLLLHDVGKPLAESFGQQRFSGHAELGAKAAAKFLERLEFDRDLIGDIRYLVRNHMLPAALKRLPLSKTEEIMESSLFPVLLELYRCDESSSFKGLEGYYESAALYRSYLKNRRNPYRSSDGKKQKPQPFQKR